MVQKVDIRTVKENKKNPRYIRDNKFKKLVKSIKDFPEMLEYRPIIVDENMTIRCLLYTSPSPRDVEEARMPSSA